MTKRCVQIHIPTFQHHRESCEISYRKEDNISSMTKVFGFSLSEMLQVPGYMLVTIISVEVDLEKTFSSLPVVSPLAASRWLAKYQPRKEARCRPLGHLEGRWNEMEDLSCNLEGR